MAAGLADVIEEGGEAMELAGGAEEIDEGDAFEEAEAVALGHAADDADDEGGVEVFAFFEGAEAGPDFLLGTFANGAGVVKYDVSEV